MFHGSIVALVTPFRNGVVDEDAFQRLVEKHLAEGTHGFVPVGTTGESPTLSHAEHERVVELCVEAVAGRRPVIAGTGSNATEEAISLTRHAKKAGAEESDPLAEVRRVTAVSLVNTLADDARMFRDRTTSSTRPARPRT